MKKYSSITILFIILLVVVTKIFTSPTYSKIKYKDKPLGSMPGFLGKPKRASVLPDLVIRSLTLSKDCYVLVRIENRGPGELPERVWTDHNPKSASVLLYVNGKIWGGQSIWRVDLARRLKKPGQVILYKSRLKINASADVKVVVDPLNIIREADETNNVLAKRLSCSGPKLTDIDHDGLPDDTEESLLKRFRPYYKFTRGEHYIPTDAVYQVRYAQLKESDWPEGIEPKTIKACGDQRESYHINPPNRILMCKGGLLDLQKNPRPTDYSLNLNDGKRKDPGNGRKNDWDYARTHATGLYGHVLRSGNLIKIEYWQFFAYNGQDPHGADHEGDWTVVELWYSTERDDIVKTCHWFHGRGACFDLGKAVRTVHLGAGFVEYQGPNFRRDLEPLVATRGIPQRHYPGSYQDHHVRFYRDTQGNKHVVVYIERDGHEFWPFPQGNFVGANEHTGNGYSYLTAYLPGKMNLGELFYPMPDSCTERFKDAKQIILRFNGRWGAYHHGASGVIDCPHGPVLHKQWSFPAGQQPSPAMLSDRSF